MNLYPFIEAERAQRHNVYRACVLLKVSRSAFYAARTAGPSQRERDDAELTDDYVVERLVMCGSVNKVVDQILQFREQVGDFGELVYAGMDWVDPKLAKRSMELMATEVMPRVNRAIGASAKPPRHVAVTGDS